MKKYLLLSSCVFLFQQLSGQTITSIVPNNGNAGQTLSVTITGNNTHFSSGSSTYVDFEFTQGSSTLTYNATSWTSMTVNFTIPSGTTSGFYDFYTYNSFDGFMFADKGFYVNGTPSQVSISPNAANPGQTLTINITGTGTNFTNIISGSGTVAYIDFYPWGGNVSANNYTVANDFLMAASFTVPFGINTAYYTLYVTDGTWHSAPNEFGVPANIGIGEAENIFQNVSATPNPFSDRVTFSGKLSRSSDAVLEIFNVKGDKIFHKDFGKLAAGNFECTLHASDFHNAPGIYFASWKCDNKSLPVKLFFVR